MSGEVLQHPRGAVGQNSMGDRAHSSKVVPMREKRNVISIYLEEDFGGAKGTQLLRMNKRNRFRKCEAGIYAQRHQSAHVRENLQAGNRFAHPRFRVHKGA
jgi:hypothetical protein